LNIFSYSSIELGKGDKNYDVILSKTIYTIELKNVFQYLGNPLLPPKIAESINALRRLTSFSPVDKNQDKATFYILGEDAKPDAVFTQNLTTFSQLKVNGGINGWLQACKNIQTSIINWYDEKGVKEINHLALATKTQ